MKIVYYRMCKLYLILEILFQLLVIPAIVMMCILGWKQYWMVATTLSYWWKNSPWFPWDSKFQKPICSNEDSNIEECGNTVSHSYNIPTVLSTDFSRKLTREEFQTGRLIDEDGTVFKFEVYVMPSHDLTVDDVKRGFWWEDDNCYMITTNVVTMPPVEEKKEI